jgi:membrane protein
MTDTRAQIKRLIQTLQEAIERFGQDHCALWSASLAYYGLLSLFPLLLFLIFLGSQVLESEAARGALDAYVRQAVPGAADTVRQVVDQTLALRGSIGLIGGLGLLWSASALFNALSVSLNAIWRVRPRSFWRRRLIATLSVLVIALLFILSISLSALAALPLPLEGSAIWRWLNAGVELAITILLFWVVYTGIPNTRVPRRAALGGGAVAAVLWQVAKRGFAWYLSSGLTNYGIIYGPLASIIALLIWAYLSAQILFLGAEISAALQRQYWRAPAAQAAGPPSAAESPTN